MMPLLKRPHPRRAREEPPAEKPFAPLRFLTVPLLLATGAAATFEHLDRSRRPPVEADGVDLRHAAREAPRPLVAGWAPLLVAPLAGAAQIARALRGDSPVRVAAQVLSGAVAGLGVAGLAASLYQSSTVGGRPSAAPLAFGAVGVLGLLLDRQEEDVSRSLAEARQRARIVERLVPRRRTKLDRIVVHA